MTMENNEDSSSGGGGKKSNDKNGGNKEDEKITQYSDGKDIYRINDTVYIESQRPDLPYYICSIKDFKRSKKDNITVDVVWFYRPCEIPATVYQLLLQDRNAENGSGEHNVLLDNPVVKERELFVSDFIDMFPASSLRGHARCNPFNDVKDYMMEYIADKDSWYYILRYNPDTRRMANAKGEIRIGASHQATLPTCIEYHKRSKEDLKELHQTCMEDIIWDPQGIANSKLVVYLRAAGSITSYSGYWQNTQESGPCIIDKNLNMVSQDLPIQYSYDMLHGHNYDLSTALQDLVCNPSPKKTMRSWSDDERKKFMKGLRSYGKTFHRIRKELLPDRTTNDLIQYYYFWKKSSIASSSRPHKRGGRRHNVLARKTRTTKPKTTETSEFLELSSCSENEFDDSDDSENVRDLSLYACRHCYTTKSPNWHHAGKSKTLLCYDCRLYFKRYGKMRPLREEEKRDPPPYIYKAAFENLEEQVPYTGRMRTRRSSTPVFCNPATMKNRILQDAKNSRNKQSTPLPTTQEAEETEPKAKNKRKAQNEEMEGKDEESKKSRVERNESDDALDADDESEDSESSSRAESSNGPSTESSRSQSPVQTTTVSESKPQVHSTTTVIASSSSVSSEMTPSIQQSVILQKPTIQPEQQMTAVKQTIQAPPQDRVENTFQPIKEENDEIKPRTYAQQQQQQQYQTPINKPPPMHHHQHFMNAHHSPAVQPELFSGPPSPEIPDDMEKLEKINQRFELRRTDPQSTCSRCERIYTFKRPKKQRNPEQEHQKRMLEEQHALLRQREKEAALKRRESGSPVISHHQPAQITSHFEMQRENMRENMQRMLQQQQQQHHRGSGERYMPYFSHDHPHRPGSPPLFEGKYPALVKGLERQPTDHRSQHATLLSPHPSHPAHPFVPQRNSEALEFHRLSQSGRGPHPPHPPHPTSAAEAYLRAHRTSGDSTPGERPHSAMDRSALEPPPVSGSLVQPHLHAHHHTHTHLHLHDEHLRNASQAEPSNPHLERREHLSIPPTPPIPTHRPSSRPGTAVPRELYEYPHHSFAAANEAQARLAREMSRHRVPHGRESHPPSVVGREGAVSPSFPHDPQEMMRDPVAYHHYVTQRKSFPHGTRHGHGQAPDLSPRGLPQNVRHNPEAFNREAIEKHLNEKLTSTAHFERAEREKIMRAEHARHMLLQERGPASEAVLKMKGEMLLPPGAERGFGREDIHSSYHYDPVRRSLYERSAHPDAAFLVHERERERIERERERERMARSSVFDRSAVSERERALNEHMLSEQHRAMTEREREHRAMSERERALNEQRALHERYMRQAQERVPHARSPMEHHLERQPHDRLPPHERAAHERASIISGHFKPETIDLSLSED
eukprot:TCONS_00025296-protein